MREVSKSEAEILAALELVKWDLDRQGWSFAWNHRKRACGLCCYRSKTIQLSTHYAAAASRDDILDTIRHEVAHALAGSRAGHGPQWKAWCVKVGARPERCSTFDGMPLGRWQATCGGCGLVITRHRYVPRPDTHYYCRKCGYPKGRLQYQDTRAKS